MAANTETKKNKGLFGFFSEVRTEMKKVHWPTPKEWLLHSGIVLVTTFVMSLFIYGLDKLYLMIIEKTV